MSLELDLASARGVFYSEARQLLGEVETYVLQLEQDPTEKETLNAAFRAAHTIKGSAGVFGLSVITHFVHDLETVLDRVRNAEIGFDADMSTLVLECRDHISDLVDAIEEGSEPDQVPADLVDTQTALTNRLKAYLTDESDDAAPASGSATNSVGASAPTQQAGADGAWHISLRLSKTTLCDGFDPAPILSYLSSYGTIEKIVPVIDALPEFMNLDPEACYLGFELKFVTEKGRDAIEEAFEFLTEGSQLHIVSHQCSEEEYDTLVKALPEGVERAIELLAQTDLHRPVTAVVDVAVPASEVANVVAMKAKEDPNAVISVPVAQKKKPAQTKSNAAANQFIRVPSDKLDALINLVGELVIANAGTVEQAKRSQSTDMIEATSQVAGLIEEIRDGALGLRMVQIGETFQRFQRVVRDISKGLGKLIQLEISGEETELDKSVVEKIGDPLMHLVRNALDHGMETPEEREAAGKNQNGKVGLHAYHDSGHIVIEVRDDGRGINRDKVLKKAIEKGIVEPGQTLTDDEINMLIFAPGFSTADAITDISGRGVGMDVVKKNIEALRGSVQVKSTPGKGTTFEIRLPLTLAIIDGFMIGVGNEVYVIPLGYVRECLELPSSEIKDDGRMDLHYDLRGEFLPCVRLRKVFNSKGPKPKRENIIVVSFGGVKAGIVTDQLHGESQTVIKPLGSLFEANRAISGATIMGNGDVALIIDVPKLVGEVARISTNSAEAA